MVQGLGGDGQTYAALLAEAAGYLRAYFARRIGAGAADLEDLVQETLLAIHLKRETYDRRQPLTPWLYAIARYKLMDSFRRAGSRRTVPLDEAHDLFAGENPEEGAVRRDVSSLLARLPARQRRLMEDVKLTGLTMEEAARSSGMSVAAVKVSVHRGMKRLQQEVSDEDL